MESRCILGFEATGLRPCGWFPLGSLSKVWLSLCDIFIALVGVCTDDINSDGVKVHFGFPGNWFGTLRMIPTGIAKLSVMVSLRYCYHIGWCLPWRHQEWWSLGALWVSRQLVCHIFIALVGVCLDIIKGDRQGAFWFPATGLRSCGWLPQGSLSEVRRALCYISIALVGVCFDFFGFPGNWLSTSWVIPTKIARGSVMGCLLYFYQCGWCLPWRHPDWRRQRAFSVLDNRFATDENGCEWHFRVHCRV